MLKTKNFLHLPNLPEKDYHLNDSISCSKMKTFIESPSKFEYQKTNPKESKALIFGSAFHSAVLTPDIFKHEYILDLKIDKRSRDGKEIYNQYLEENRGKIILSDVEMNVIFDMRNRLFRVTKARAIIETFLKEQSFIFIDEESDLKCKARVDLMNANCVGDLKTTDSISDFGRTVYNYKYYMQAAWYLDIASNMMFAEVEFNDFFFIAIEKAPPYDVGLFYLDRDAIERGRKLYRKTLNEIRDYQIKKFLDDGVNDRIDFQTISLPAWSNE